MMMLCGIALLIWVMFRRNIRSKRQSRQADIQWKAERTKMASRASSGAPLADAPVDVARWQAGMFDLQRDLKAELDTKIAIVQSLVRLADQRIQTLQQLATPASNIDLKSRTEKISELANIGKTPSEIATMVGMSIGDVEFLLSVATPSRTV